jgi:hypothetical protein
MHVNDEIMNVRVLLNVYSNAVNNKVDVMLLGIDGLGVGLRHG